MAFTDNAMRALFLLALVCVVQAGGKAAPAASKDAKADVGAAKGGSCPGGSCDITKLGASGDGKTDSTKALEEAWASACGGTGKNAILIPKGDYLVGPLNFTGPCKGDVTIQVDGNLLASTDLSLYKGNWIEILRVDSHRIPQGARMRMIDERYDPSILSIAILSNQFSSLDAW